MTFDFLKSKYNIVITSRFKKDYKKIIKQNKDKNKLIYILKKLANPLWIASFYFSISTFIISLGVQLIILHNFNMVNTVTFSLCFNLFRVLLSIPFFNK